MELLSKVKSKKWIGVVLLFLFLSLISVSVYAKTEPKEIYSIGKYHLDTFSSYVSDTDYSLGKMLFGKNGTDFIQMITNMSFGLNKIIWQAFDFIIEKLYEGAAMDGLIHTFFQFSKNIYDKLFNVVGLALTGVYVVYIFYLKVFKSSYHAKRSLIRFISIVSFSIIWFGNGSVASQGEELTKKLNTWSTAVEGLIFEATDGIDDLSAATTSEDAIKQVREMYYRKAVVDTYLLLNYGTTNIDELEKVGIQGHEFLKGSIKEDDLDSISKDVNAAAKEEDEKTTPYRAFIRPTKAIYKIIVGGMSPLLNTSLGVPILLIGMVRFLFQLGALMMLLAIPFLLIVSFFPEMDYLIFRGIKSFIGFIFQRSIYSVLILVAFLVFNIIDDMIAMNTIAGFIGNMIVRGIVSLTVIIKRKSILAKLGLGQADKTLSKAKTKAQETKREVVTTARRGRDLTQQVVLKGADVAGKIHPGLMAASQLYQRTKQQRNTPVRDAKVGNTQIADGRKKQLPYERKQVISATQPPVGLPTAAVAPSARKIAEPIKGQVAANISGSIPLTVSKLPIDRLINRRAGGMNEQKLTMTKPSMKHIGQSVPLSHNAPKLIANDSLTQQITQLKQSRALVNNQTRMNAVNQISEHSQNDRTIKIPGNSKDPVSINNQAPRDQLSGKGTGQTIEAQLGRDFTLPKGRSPQS